MLKPDNIYGPLVKWLRHRPFTAITGVRLPYGSLWEHSSAGRASALQAEGHRFEPCCSHKREHRMVFFFYETECAGREPAKERSKKAKILNLGF